MKDLSELVPPGQDSVPHFALKFLYEFVRFLMASLLMTIF